MPETEVILFSEDDGSVPLLAWLDKLPAKAQDKCIVKIERLAAVGHELRRPEADFLRDGVYELRVSLQGIHYRVLYFFQGTIAVISHGLIKASKVPPEEIDLAIDRKFRFAKNPARHTHQG
ncbi:MAG: type II toxin-antitoxin system RelE/ParE family toxin [Deltaproteobacteria bacterium]|nr:MAG: type II toxin-antitoxin system RelE/ParE family toxin [Deltaproteobacteria bacterium]